MKERILQTGRGALFPPERVPEGVARCKAQRKERLEAPNGM